MLGSAILYVILSTTANQEGIYESETFDKLDKVVCSMILFMWLVKFYVSQNKKQYMKKLQTISDLIVAAPILIIFKPDIFDNSYVLIIISRYVRIILAAFILMTEKISGNELTSQLYKMMINLTMLIFVSALLFTGIEN